MNKQRRKDIEDVRARLEELRDEIEALKNDEEEYYDNMPESFQNGERGEKAQEAIDDWTTLITA